MRLSSTATHTYSLKQKKKSFLLLEVLISIFILSICLIPLVKQPLCTYLAELNHLEEIERERLANWTFSEIQEQFLNQQIPWGKIPKPNEHSADFLLPPFTLEIPGMKTKQLQRSFSLRCSKTMEKEGLHGELYRKIKIDIQFFPKIKNSKQKYTYSLIVKKNPEKVSTNRSE